MRGDDEHQTAHTPIALMLCSKLENLATMPRRAQAQHKCEDNIMHVDAVKETFQGKTVWERIVEVFDLKGHPAAFRVYAWSHDTDDPASPKRLIAVLHQHPV